MRTSVSSGGAFPFKEGRQETPRQLGAHLLCPSSHAFFSVSSLENCIGNEKLIVLAAESKRWKANFETPSDNIPKAMGSAVIGLTSYRCEVDGAHGGADEETWLYRLLHSGANDGWAVDPRVSDSTVRFSFSLWFSPASTASLSHSTVSILASKIWFLDPAAFLLRRPHSRGPAEHPCSHNS